MTVKDVAPAKLIAAYAAHLKKTGQVVVPAHIDIAKNATHSELSAYDEDWYYIRMASLARKIYLGTKGTHGVGSFRRIYGGSCNRGVAPSRFSKASGNMIRKALHSLEALKIVKRSDDGSRIISQVGQRDLDRVAAKLL